MFLWISKFFIKDYKNTDSPYVQLAYIRFVSWISIIINVLQSIIKIGLGYSYSAMALLSDGIDSFTNVVSSIILLLAYQFLASKETIEYPFGSGRVVYIANFIIAILLAFTGLEIIIFSVKHLFSTDSLPIYNYWTLGIIFCFLVINEVLTHFCFFVAKRIQSSTLHTEAIHRRWDNILSIVVLVAGITSLYGLFWVDSITGILFAFIILRSSYSIAKENINELLGVRPPEKLVEQIIQIGREVPGVINIHEIVIHSYGKRTLASMHVEINENILLKQAHKICDQLEDLLEQRLNIYATTHADPYNTKDPNVNIIVQNKEHLLSLPFVNTLIMDIGHIYTGTDHSDPEKLFISLDLFLKTGVGQREFKDIYKILSTELEKIIPQKFRLKIRPRPLFGSNTMNKT